MISHKSAGISHHERYNSDMSVQSLEVQRVPGGRNPSSTLQSHRVADGTGFSIARPIVVLLGRGIKFCFVSLAIDYDSETQKAFFRCQLPGISVRMRGGVDEALARGLCHIGLWRLRHGR